MFGAPGKRQTRQLEAFNCHPSPRCANATPRRPYLACFYNYAHGFSGLRWLFPGPSRTSSICDGFVFLSAITIPSHRGGKSCQCRGGNGIPTCGTKILFALSSLLRRHGLDPAYIFNTFVATRPHPTRSTDRHIGPLRTPHGSSIHGDEPIEPAWLLGTR